MSSKKEHSHTLSPVWIIDDDKGMHVAVRSALERGGYSVKTFTSAEELLADGHDTNPEVVLIDVMLPGMSGIELTRIVRKRFPPAKIIVMTGSPSATVLGQAFLGGADAFLAKPLPPSTILAAVKAVIAGTTPLISIPSASIQDGSQRNALTSDIQSERLSHREWQVMGFVAQGLADKEIAFQLGLSEDTVGDYLRSIYRKLGVHSRSAAITQCMMAGSKIPSSQDDNHCSPN